MRADRAGPGRPIIDQVGRGRRAVERWRLEQSRFDGFVAEYMGAAVLAYFGYPNAHEDDAERAVRAGLELELFRHAAPDCASPRRRPWNGRRESRSRARPVPILPLMEAIVV